MFGKTNLKKTKVRINQGLIKRIFEEKKANFWKTECSKTEFVNKKMFDITNFRKKTNNSKEWIFEKKRMFKKRIFEKNECSKNECSKNECSKKQFSKHHLAAVGPEYNTSFTQKHLLYKSRLGQKYIMFIICLGKNIFDCHELLLS